MRRRRRSRRRSGRTWQLVFAVAVVSLIAFTLTPPSASFSAGTDTSAVGVLVVGDESAIHALSNHSAMKTGETCKLVTVTNNFERTVTVTVSLREGSEAYGNLTLGNGRLGNETSFSLGAGVSETVGLEIKNDTTYDGDDVYFHANASGDGVDVVATDRYSSIDDGTSTTDCEMTV